MIDHTRAKRSGPGRAASAALFVLLAITVITAGGEVVDVSASGFTVENTATIAALPGEVYTCLVKDVGKWWSPDHTYSGDAGNLSLDARAGGLFTEKLAGGGSVLHLTVVYADPGKRLRLSGGLGPLQAAAVNGSLTWELNPERSGTTVTLTYAVGGYMPGGLEGIAPRADKMLAEQLRRLKAYSEKK